MKPKRVSQPAEPQQPQTIELDNKIWLVCPVGGVQCCRISTSIGLGWAADAMSVHMHVSHRLWPVIRPMPSNNATYPRAAARCHTLARSGGA